MPYSGLLVAREGAWASPTTRTVQKMVSPPTENNSRSTTTCYEGYDYEEGVEQDREEDPKKHQEQRYEHEKVSSPLYLGWP